MVLEIDKGQVNKVNNEQVHRVDKGQVNKVNKGQMIIMLIEDWYTGLTRTGIKGRQETGL
jgi:hypothetical protein